MSSNPSDETVPAPPNSGTEWRSTLLVVSRDSQIVDGLRRRLQQTGQGVESADTAEYALARATEHPPAVIVIDADTSGVDGCALAQRLKTADETRFVPIVLLSSASNSARAYKSGVDDVRAKPVDFDELTSRVHSLLRSRVLYQNLLEENHELQAAYDTHRHSEQLYRALFDTLPLSVFAVNAKTHTITHANRAATVLTGYHPEILNGLAFAKLSPGDSGVDWLNGLFAEQPSAATSQGTIVAADGRRIAVEAAVSRIDHMIDPLVVVVLTDLGLRSQGDRARIEAERVAMLRETAIAVNSRINDPLFVILNDIGSLQTALKSAEGSLQSRLARALEAAQRIQRVTAQLSAITTVVTREYLPGVRMLDLDESVGASVERAPEPDND